MTTRNALAGLVLLAPLSLAAALENDHTRPDKPAVPDGTQVTEDQLSDEQEAVRTFIAAGDAYRNCLVAEVKAQGEPETDADKTQQQAYTDEFNSMVDDMRGDGAEFNEAVQAYNAQ
jgi:hypothetical protein